MDDTPHLFLITKGDKYNIMTKQEISSIQSICATIEQRLKDKHIGCFKDSDISLLLISTEYPGLWLEHVYDSVFYAKMYPSQLEIAKNTILVFIENQTPEGQYPCYYWDAAKIDCKEDEILGYCQIQECVSFASLCCEVCEMINDSIFTERVYESVRKWDGWLRKYRMTRGLGLVEMFVGYDTGHDHSGRLKGLTYPGNYMREGKRVNAGIMPPNDDVTPIFAVDMNANFYGTQKALAKLANMCGKCEEAAEWDKKAADVKARLFEFCYDEKDAFFYDVDRHGNKRKYLSSTILHLFMEKVLDPKEDKTIIDAIYTRHLKNPNEFWTEYPFPSMAVCDPSCENHRDYNCWGYYSQALIVLRCTMWMDDYGFQEEFDYICEKWLKAWTACYNDVKLGQELDPLTGEPTSCSEWYSSCMLFYLYAAKRLGISTAEGSGYPFEE